MKVSKLNAILSLVLTVLSFTVIYTKGFDYGVDFAGGIEVQVQFASPVSASQVRDFTTSIGYPDASVQAFGEDNEYLIRVGMEKGKDAEEANRLLNETVGKMRAGFKENFKDLQPNIRRVDTVGPQVGKELRNNGLLAGFYALLMILIYIGLRFDYEFAPGAVFCLFHDCVIVLGIYALCGLEVNTQTLAAILTLIGYSINDTIIIYDRVRENMPIYRSQNLWWVANRSINDTLSRTILTSGTTFITVFVMYFLAGGVIADFALTMMIGIVLGTYSSIYVAVPLVVLFENFHKKKVA